MFKQIFSQNKSWIIKAFWNITSSKSSNNTDRYLFQGTCITSIMLLCLRPKETASFLIQLHPPAAIWRKKKKKKEEKEVVTWTLALSVADCDLRGGNRAYEQLCSPGNVQHSTERCSAAATAFLSNTMLSFGFTWGSSLCFVPVEAEATELRINPVNPPLVLLGFHSLYLQTWKWEINSEMSSNEKWLALYFY